MKRATIDHLLVQSGKLYTTHYGKAGGNIILGAFVTVNCRLREINQEQDAPNNAFISSQAILWLPAGTSVKLDDVFEDENAVQYRISQITQARHGSDPTVKFIKCLVERFV